MTVFPMDDTRPRPASNGMSDTIEIIPTCVSKDEAALSAGSKAIRSFSPSIHIDIDDGVFTPELTWPYSRPGEFSRFDLSGASGLVKEVHLMVEEPRTIGIEFARAGAFRIIAHVEAFSDPTSAHGALDAWKHNGAREAGFALLMATPLEVIEPVIPACNVVHLMLIETIGMQGIPFSPRSIMRVADFHERFPDVFISVDGGVSGSNIVDLVRAGARRFGVGAAISSAIDPAAEYAHLRELAESAIV